MRAADLLHDLAHEVADGRWLALGGGGYAVVDVVPRSWTHLLGIATHHPVDPATQVPDGVALAGARAVRAARPGPDDRRS